MPLLHTYNKVGASHKCIFGSARLKRYLLNIGFNRCVIHFNKIRCLLRRESGLLRFWGDLLANGEEHVAVFHVVFAKSIRLQRAGRVVARVATEVGRCWTLSLILIDLLCRPTPFAALAWPRRAAASPRKATRRSDVMSRRGQRNNPPAPCRPDFCPRATAPSTSVDGRAATICHSKIAPRRKKQRRVGGVSPKGRIRNDISRDRIFGGEEGSVTTWKDFREAWMIRGKKKNSQKLNLHVDITYTFSRFTRLEVPERFMGEWKSVITTLSSSAKEWILHSREWALRLFQNRRRVSRLE